jgi:hypothetical protein
MIFFNNLIITFSTINEIVNSDLGIFLLCEIFILGRMVFLDSRSTLKIVLWFLFM